MENGTPNHGATPNEVFSFGLASVSREHCQSSAHGAKALHIWLLTFREWMEPGPPASLIGAQAASQTALNMVPPSPSAVPGVLSPEVFRVNFPRKQSFGLLVQGVGRGSSCCSGERGYLGSHC
uniref:Uncharacterized protein n=1 Tax=Myotis myotis TaxID=51298 RepID=A0A7J7ZX80_MYOMY|nr:hypothetical protein mMyoMyo1_009607 [Myotis myotis]